MNTHSLSYFQELLVSNQRPNSMVKGSDLAPISRASQIDNQQRSSARSTTRDHKREHKRELILNSAIEVFAQRGFHNSRVSDVARCAGVADGTIYLYFKSKDDLLISLFEEKMEQIVERFRAEVNQRDNARDRMRCFIELHLNMVADHPTLAEVLTVELRQSAKFMREYKAPQFGAYLNLLGEIITFGQERREVNSSLDPHFARRIIFGALDELSLYWVSLKRPDETLDQAIDALWLICTGGLFVHQSGDL